MVLIKNLLIVRVWDHVKVILFQSQLVMLMIVKKVMLLGPDQFSLTKVA